MAPRNHAPLSTHKSIGIEDATKLERAVIDVISSIGNRMRAHEAKQFAHEMLQIAQLGFKHGFRAGVGNSELE
jgi:hypothetical protein